MFWERIGAASGAATAAPAKESAAAAKKEEKEAPKEEEADVDMGGLFGDDYWAALLMFSCF